MIKAKKKLKIKHGHDIIHLPPIPEKIRPDFSFTAKRLNKEIDEFNNMNVGTITEPDVVLPKIPGYADSLVMPKVKLTPIISDYMLDMLILLLGSSGFLTLGFALGLWVNK